MRKGIARLVYVLLLLFFITAPVHGAEWWDSRWHYRFNVTINTSDYNRTNAPIELSVNFTSKLRELGMTSPLDQNSIRVVEYLANGTHIAYNNSLSGTAKFEVPSQFDINSTYATGNEIGEVVWILNGTTLESVIRNYFIYFDVNNSKSPGNYTNITYSFNGTSIGINTTMLELKIDTNRTEMTSGLYYATRKDSSTNIFDTPNTQRSVEYIQTNNGTNSLGYMLAGNASFKVGAVRMTIEQTGDETLFGTTIKTGQAKIKKVYKIYSDGAIIRIEQTLTNNGSSAISRNTTNISTLSIDADKAFGIDALTGSVTDPFSYQSAYSLTNKALGVINEIETGTSNYSARGSLVEGRIGIKLATTILNPGDNISETAVIYFGDSASHVPTQDMKNRIANPVSITVSNTDQYNISASISANFTIYNRNETVLITLTTIIDTFNQSKNANATLSMGTGSSNDDTLVQLYDDGTHNDSVAGDKLFTTAFMLNNTANVSQWNITGNLYDANGNILSSPTTVFNVSSSYTTTLLIENPIGINGRLITANFTVRGVRNDTPIAGASIACSINDGAPVSDIVEIGNGLYRINFTSTSVPGSYNMTCNGTRVGNFGNATQPFITEDNTTQVNLTVVPENINATGITGMANQTFIINITVSNIGNSTAYSTNISFGFPANWTRNATPSCGNISAAGSCNPSIILTIPANAQPGNYTLNVTINWTNLDSTTNRTAKTINVTVFSNKTMIVPETSIARNITGGASFIIGNFTVNSTGNDIVSSINITCASGDACNNFTLVFSQSFISSLPGNGSQVILVNATAPGNFSTGTYNGTINITSDAGNDSVFVTIGVQEKTTWTASPLSCSSSVIPNSTGQICIIVINSTGNVPINITITPNSANFTSLNETNFTLPTQGAHSFKVSYNTSGAGQLTYTTHYKINSTSVQEQLNISISVFLGPSAAADVASASEQASGIMIKANISDRSGVGINFVRANITRPDAVIDIISLTNTSANTAGANSTWQFNYTNTSQRGNYSIIIYSDDNGNSTGQNITSFIIYAKLNITLQTGFRDYFAGESGSVNYIVTDANGTVQAANVTLTLKDSDGNVRMLENFLTINTTGKPSSIKTFQIQSDAPRGVYTLSSQTSFSDSVVNINVTKEVNLTFNVYEKLKIDMDTSVATYPNNVLRMFVLVSAEENLTEPTDIILTTYDPANNVFFNITKSSMTKLQQGASFVLYQYQYSIANNVSLGAYIALADVRQGNRSTPALKTFRVSAGGPFDVVITSIDSEVPKGDKLDFSVMIENNGDLSQDVTLDYYITGTDGTMYDSVFGEAVLVNSGTNKTFGRQLSIFSTQSTGTYLLNVRVTFSTLDPTIKTNRTFLVTAASTSTPAASSSGGGGGSSGGTGYAAQKQKEPNVDIESIIPSNINVEKGGVRYANIVVKNNGGKGNISADITGLPKEWYEIIVTKPTLDQDESGTILVKFSVPDNADSGNYTALIRVSSDANYAEGSINIRAFDSAKSLFDALIQEVRDDIKQLEAEIAGKRDVEEPLRLLERASALLKIAEDFANDNNFIRASESLTQAKNNIEQARYLLGKTKEKPFEIDYLIVVIAAVAASFATIAITHKGAFAAALKRRKKQKIDKKQEKDYSKQDKNTKKQDDTNPVLSNDDKEKARKRMENMIENAEKHYKLNMISKEAYDEIISKYKKRLNDL